MVSASLLIIWFSLSFALYTAAIYYGARAANSERARPRIAALATAVFMTISQLIALVMSSISAPTNPLAQFVALGVAFGSQVWLTFRSLRFLFKLNGLNALLPFATLIGASIVMSLVATVVIRPHVAEAMTIPTHSMSPTMEMDDRFLVNKMIKPRRWDIVAYWHKENAARVRYAKRLVGLPGERMRFEGGQLYVNDEVVPAPPVLGGRLTAEYPPQARIRTRFRDGQTFTLGRDEIFLLCDNLDLASDSRIGDPQSASSIVGVVDCVYWPPSRAGFIR